MAGRQAERRPAVPMAGRYGVSTSMMLGANAAFVLLADEVALTRPLNAIRERIDAAAPR